MNSKLIRSLWLICIAFGVICVGLTAYALYSVSLYQPPEPFIAPISNANNAPSASEQNILSQPVNIQDRPLFWESRRPAEETPIVEAPRPVQRTGPDALESFVISGVLGGEGFQGVLFRLNNQNQRAQLGDEIIDGWMLAQIDGHTVILTRDAESANSEMRTFEIKPVFNLSGQPANNQPMGIAPPPFGTAPPRNNAPRRDNPLLGNNSPNRSPILANDPAANVPSFPLGNNASNRTNNPSNLPANAPSDAEMNALLEQIETLSFEDFETMEEYEEFMNQIEHLNPELLEELKF